MGFFDRFFGPPNEHKFARIMMQALRNAGDDHTAVYDKVGFRLVRSKDGQEGGVMNLHNLFKEYCKTPSKDRAAWMARTCVGLLNRVDLPEDFEDVKPDLMPTVRPRSMFEFLDLKTAISGGKSMNIASLPLTEQLVVCLVYDLPSAMQFVSQKNLDDWGITLYEAYEIACQNLAELPFSMLSLDEKLFVVQSGDAYDGTRVLLKDHIRKLKLNGHPIAMPATRDILLITGSDDVEGLTLMLALADQQKDEARPLCPIPMQLVADDWESWLPPTDHPAYRGFKDLECKFNYVEYSDQKDLLEQKLDLEQDNPVFVATYSVLERDDKVLSFSVWSKSVPTWLPKTDCVGLFDPEVNSHRFIRWEKLQNIVGSMMEPLDLFPLRWYVNDFPTEEQIVQMEPEE